MANQVTGDFKTGCNFDAATAKAVHGRTVLMLVFDKTGTEPLAISGQQGLSFSLEQDNSENQTKDGDGTWTVRTPGTKSWSASVDGLYSYDDEARKTVLKAIIEGTFLCIGLYAREKVDGGYKYTPVRRGLAIPSSSEDEFPNDDNATYSVEFDGTGECWCQETADAEEIESMTVTVTTQTQDSEG